MPAEPQSPHDLTSQPQIATVLPSFEELPDASSQVENQLAITRLGIAGSLFLALCAHHAPTARHSLRVAVNVSAWAAATDLTASQRDELEVAALLHDVGKVGVPEEILRHPGSLSPDQVALVLRAREHAVEILSPSCDSENILTTIRHVDAWYDGSKPGFSLCGERIPIAARMIAVSNVFDAMTTDRVYRKAVSTERAIAELFEFSGTQFDPTLVNHFATIQTAHPTKALEQTARRWLLELQDLDANQYWRRQTGNASVDFNLPFHEALFEHLPGGAFYVLSDLTICRWNKSLEHLTGIPAPTAIGCAFEPMILELCDQNRVAIDARDCPVHHAIISGTRFSHDMCIKAINGRVIPVEMQCVPIQGSQGSCLGAAVIFRDTSSEDHLEKRVQSLHIKATQDPLTGVANRAEFDRLLLEMVDHGHLSGKPFSLIISDIDRFKQVNDKHGHQAGDEALISFAKLLRRQSRHGDIVARYGGEEFVMLCPGCNCAEAAHLAEKIRAELAQTPLSELGGNCVTASFGVTELQPGDSPESILRRADRGLLQAKDSGRNMVMQLGVGSDRKSVLAGAWLSNWWHRPAANNILERCLMINVPVNITVQKLCGFISDHNAEIVTLDNSSLDLRLNSIDTSSRRRKSDRPLPLLIRLQFSCRMAHGRNHQQTIVQVSMRLVRQRDRRQNPTEHARSILRSLMSYLVAQECAPTELLGADVQPVAVAKLLKSLLG